jgi:RNA polymerase sigma factor for flagellar operon FliA
MSAAQDTASAQREAAVRELLPLVRGIARSLHRLVGGADLDDLIGDGCVGLVRALDAFDPARGVSREQYVRRVVIGAMLNGVRRLDPVGERHRRIVRYAERERYALAVARGAFPAEAELEARHPGLARARQAVASASVLSLDAPLPTGTAHPAMAAANPADVLERLVDHRRVRRAVGALPERQRTIVLQHYFAERPLRALGADMHVSAQRVSQLHLAALARMRRALGTP